MRGFLQNLAELSGSESIDHFFGMAHCRTHKLGLGNEKMYPGAGDIGKRIREATRYQSQPTPPATPLRGGAGGEVETEESCIIVPLCRYNNTNIAHSFSIHRPSSVHVHVPCTMARPCVAIIPKHE